MFIFNTTIVNLLCCLNNMCVCVVVGGGGEGGGRGVVQEMKPFSLATLEYLGQIMFQTMRLNSVCIAQS